MKTAIISGCRTAFSRSGTVFAGLSAMELGKVAVRDALARSGLKGERVDQLVYGTVVHDPKAPNIAREVGLAVLPKTVPAFTVSRACTSANQAIADAAQLIEIGQADVVMAGGSESLSHVPITVSDKLSKTLGLGLQGEDGRPAPFTLQVRPTERISIPVQPAIAEPTTGETMGESAERMAKENGISRDGSGRLGAPLAPSGRGRVPRTVA